MNSTAESDDGAERNFLKLGHASIAPDDGSTAASDFLTPYAPLRTRKSHLHLASSSTAFWNPSSESATEQGAEEDDSDSDVSPKTQVERAFERRALAEKAEEKAKMREEVKADKEAATLRGAWLSARKGRHSNRDLEVRATGDGVHFMVPRGVREVEDEDEGDREALRLHKDEGWMLGMSPGSFYDEDGFLRETRAFVEGVGVGE